MNSADVAMTDHADRSAQPSDASHHSSGHSPPYRRRPIVVRDPRTGQTRIIGEGGGPSSSRVPLDHRRYRGTLDAKPYPSERFKDDSSSGGGGNAMPFEDEGRAPILKIVSGYRGRQIVVRDPSRRADGIHAHNASSSLGVRGGVRKAPHFDRRVAARSPSYGDGYDGHDDGVDGRYGGGGGAFDPRRGGGGGGMVTHDGPHGGGGGGGIPQAPYYDARFARGAPPHEMDGRAGVATQAAAPSHMGDYGRNGRMGSDGGFEDEEDLTGRVVYVDNLSDDVTTTGLADLFGMVGAVKELRLLYDRQGKPNGSADIIFQRRADAAEAIKSLHNVPLNNRPMHLSMGNSV